MSKLLLVGIVLPISAVALIPTGCGGSAAAKSQKKATVATSVSARCQQLNDLTSNLAGTMTGSVHGDERHLKKLKGLAENRHQGMRATLKKVASLYEASMEGLKGVDLRTTSFGAIQQKLRDAWYSKAHLGPGGAVYYTLNFTKWVRRACG
jgi:hypothetical protein